MTYRLLVWAQAVVLAIQAMTEKIQMRIVRLQTRLMVLEMRIVRRQTELQQSGEDPR
jgi:hypothetical protein